MLERERERGRERERERATERARATEGREGEFVRGGHGRNRAGDWRRGATKAIAIEYFLVREYILASGRPDLVIASAGGLAAKLSVASYLRHAFHLREHILVRKHILVEHITSPTTKLGVASFLGHAMQENTF